MGDITKTIIVAGNYRTGTTWLAEMLCRGLGYELVFEPLRIYFPTVANAGLLQWRPYLTSATATAEQTRVFRMFLDGSICTKEKLVRTDRERVLASDQLVVKFVRGLMSLRWMCDTFPIRHAFVIVRNPLHAVASQVRRRAIRDTPMNNAELQRFKAEHPEIDLPRVPRKTGVQWLALWWATSYHAALSTPQPHPWTLVRYEDLYRNTANCDALFNVLGETPSPYHPDQPSLTMFDDRIHNEWERTLTPAQAEEVREVIACFPMLHQRFMC